MKPRSDYQAGGIERLSEMIESMSFRMAAMEANMATKQDLAQLEAKMEALGMAQMKANIATKQDLEQLGKVVSDSLRAFSRSSSSSDKHRR